MDITVLRPTPCPSDQAAGEAIERQSSTGEWLDPEGDDWLQQLYRELVGRPADQPQDGIAGSDPGHWFG